MAARINGRPVLQPTDNRVPPTPLDRRNSLIKKAPAPPPPTSPKSKSPKLPAIKRSSSSTTTTTTTGGGGGTTAATTTTVVAAATTTTVAAAAATTTTTTPVEIESPKRRTLERKKSTSFFKESSVVTATTNQPSSIIVDDNDQKEAQPGSIAAVRREQIALQQAQRKMKIAHYGRRSSKLSAKLVEQLIEDDPESRSSEKQKRCSFITPNSDPVYVAYHDQEWGVPVHDDKMLLELLVLSGAQVGSDWTSLLKKRKHFRDAFSGFDAQALAAATPTDKEILAISSQYEIEITRVRAVVDNSNRILEVNKEFGSFDKYIWGFVNHKPISAQYKFGHKIPVKTSKSESISKDMVRRGFRFVGPTVVYSFMQAAGLTNDHLITCPHRHHRIQ